MTIKKIEVFEATDGTRHDTEAEARLHDQKQDMRTWYYENALYDERTVPFDDVIEWLIRHPAEVRKLLQLFR